MNFASASNRLVPYISEVYRLWQIDSKQIEKNLTTVKPEAADSSQYPIKGEEKPESQHRNRIQCTKGCAACCYFPVISASAGEAFFLLLQLLAAEKSLAEINELFGTYARNYFQACHKNGGLPFTDDKQTLFMKEKRPCPLLKVGSSLWTGECSIYPNRPLICDYFHSTDSPSKCASKEPHGLFSELVERGENAVEQIRNFERSVFGRSCMGHLPLLVYALTTQSGMDAFLKEVRFNTSRTPDPSGTADQLTEFPGDEIEWQHHADFELYLELMEAAGYQVTSEDIHNLIEAQNQYSAGI
jgi:Fe-S-cluster containining protein